MHPRSPGWLLLTLVALVALLAAELHFQVGAGSGGRSIQAGSAPAGASPAREPPPQSSPARIGAVQIHFMLVSSTLAVRSLDYNAFQSNGRVSGSQCQPNRTLAERPG